MCNQTQDLILTTCTVDIKALAITVLGGEPWRGCLTERSVCKNLLQPWAAHAYLRLRSLYSMSSLLSPGITLSLVNEILTKSFPKSQEVETGFVLANQFWFGPSMKALCLPCSMDVSTFCGPWSNNFKIIMKYCAKREAAPFIIISRRWKASRTASTNRKQYHKRNAIVRIWSRYIFSTVTFGTETATCTVLLQTAYLTRS